MATHDPFSQIQDILAQGRRAFVIRRRRRIVLIGLALIAVLLALAIAFACGERTEEREQIQAMREHRPAQVLDLFHLGYRKAAN